MICLMALFLQSPMKTFYPYIARAFTLCFWDFFFQLLTFRSPFLVHSAAILCPILSQTSLHKQELFWNSLQGCYSLSNPPLLRCLFRWLSSFMPSFFYYLCLCNAQVLPRFNQLFCADTILFQIPNISNSLKLILLIRINLLQQLFSSQMHLNRLLSKVILWNMCSAFLFFSLPL